MSNVTQAIGDRVTNASLAVDAAHAKLRVKILTRGTVENPHQTVRSFGGILYPAWCIVPAPKGWQNWTALGFGDVDEVAAYNAAADELSDAMDALLAASRRAA